MSIPQTDQANATGLADFTKLLERLGISGAEVNFELTSQGWVALIVLPDTDREKLAQLADAVSENDTGTWSNRDGQVYAYIGRGW